MKILVLILLLSCTKTSTEFKNCTQYFKKTFGKDVNQFCSCKIKIPNHNKKDINTKLNIISKCINK